jgi:NTE family protein
MLLLRDFGSPPLYGYALAASVAWHTRQRTVLVVADPQRAPELRAFVGESSGLGAHIATCTPEEVERTVDRLSAAGYDQIIVEVTGETPAPAVSRAGVVHLAGGEAVPLDGASHTLVPGGAVRAGPAGLVRVPPFADADLAALRRGFLPGGAAPGDAIGRVARSVSGLSVGLALGSGSVRGFAHLGVLRVLERVGLRPDYVAGTSVGAAAAALYALDNDPDTAAAILEQCGKTLIRYGLPVKGLLSSRGLRAFIQEQAGERMIEDLPIPLALVAADLLTGAEVVFRRGLLWQAVVASMTIPGVYPALRIGEHLLVDGGVLNPVPASVAAAMGADVVLAVKLVGDSGRQTDAEAIPASGRPPSAIAVIMRSLELMQGRITSDTPNARTITITPALGDLPPGKLRSFSNGQRFVEAGQQATEAALPRIAAALPWLQPEPGRPTG